MNPWIIVADLSLGFLKQLLTNLTKSNAPAEIIDAVQSVIDKLELHWNDQITKSSLEDQRG